MSDARRDGLRTTAVLAASGAGVGLGLATFDGVLAGVRGAGLAGGLFAAAASAALLVLPALAVGAIAGALVAGALGPPALPERLAALWRARGGPPYAATARVCAAIVAVAVFFALHRAATGAIEEGVRSVAFRTLSAVLVAIGAWGVAALAGRMVASRPLAARPRPRTVVALLSLALAVLWALPWIVARPFAEALGIEWFLAPVAALAGAAVGFGAGTRGRARLLVAGAVVVAFAGAAALFDPDTRATVAFDTVAAQRVQALLPAAVGAATIAAEPAPPVFAPAAPRALVARRPIVVVSLDAVGADHLGLHGYVRRTSPTLDAWARGAVVFDAATAPGPVTRLSVPSFFVGKHASQVAMTRRTGVTNAQRRADTTLAERLAAAGYRTVAVPGGRYFVGFRGLTQGFQVVDRTAADRTRRLETRGAIVTARARLALEEARARPEPTFLWIHYDDAHAPHSSVAGTPRFGDREIDRYDQEIRWIDGHLAELLPAIDRALGDRDPLVLVTADHGERFGPGGRALDRAQALVHGTLWVPLLVRMKGLPPHRVRGAVSLLDLAPTVLDLAGLRPRERFEGRSLVPELLGRRDDRSRVVFAELDQAGPRVLDSVAARRGDALLVVDRLRGARRAFDLGRDPRAERPSARVPGALMRRLEAHVVRLTLEHARRFPTAGTNVR